MVKFDEKVFCHKSKSGSIYIQKDCTELLLNLCIIDLWGGQL